MPETKKLLVAFDPERPKSQASDFLVPFQVEGRTVLYGLKSASEQSLGLMIYVGRAVTENDLFAKLVDAGTKIENVEATLARLRQYIEQLPSFRVGNVVQLKTNPDGNADFELELVANTPAGVSR